MQDGERLMRGLCHEGRPLDLGHAVRHASSPLFTRPAADEVALWLYDVDSPDPTHPEVPVLSAAESARAGSFRYDRDRRRFVGRCRAVRATLAALGVAGMRQGAEIPVVPGGKPVLPEDDLALSWAHSRGLVLLAVTPAPRVGADLERLQHLPDLPGLARTALHPDEIVELGRAPIDASEEFLGYWTAKEALLKGTGDGLFVEPASVSLRRTPDGGWSVRDAPSSIHPVEWRISAVRLADAVAAVAAPPTVTRLSVRLHPSR